MDTFTIEMKINGEPHQVTIAPQTLLVDLLRDTLGLTGTKIGCGVGECGSCTVIMDGKAVNSCLVLAIDAHGAEITTVEGLAEIKSPSPLQESFVEHGAIQCGFCTPGMLMSADALLRRNPKPDENEIKTAISGNLCRCGSYLRIIEAIRSVESK